MTAVDCESDSEAEAQAPSGVLRGAQRSTARLWCLRMTGEDLAWHLRSGRRVLGRLLERLSIISRRVRPSFSEGVKGS